MCLQGGQLFVEQSNRGSAVVVDRSIQSVKALVTHWTHIGIVDKIVQEGFISAHFVLDLADPLDDGFTSLDPLFCDGRGEIVRLGS